jgi:hypothetical protein
MSRAFPCVQKFDFASSRPHQVASKLQIGQDELFPCVQKFDFASSRSHQVAIKLQIGASCARAMCADVRCAHADAVVEVALEIGAAKSAGGAPDYRRRRRSLAGASLPSHGGDARDAMSLQEMGNKRNVWHSSRNGSGQKKKNSPNVFFHLRVARWVICLFSLTGGMVSNFFQILG